MDWWKDMDARVRVLIAVGTLLGMLGGGAYAAWDKIGIATVQHVEQHVEHKIAPIRLAGEQTRAIVKDLQVGQVEKDRADLYRERFQWSIRMKELPDNSPARADYEWRILEIDRSIRDRERKIEALEKERAN